MNFPTQATLRPKVEAARQRIEQLEIELAQATREYLRVQLPWWRQLRMLSMAAEGRSGWSATLAHCYEYGLWNPNRGGGGGVFVDVQSGRLIQFWSNDQKEIHPHVYKQYASDGDTDAIDAVARLCENVRNYPDITNHPDGPGWRRAEEERLHIVPRWVRACSSKARAPTQRYPLKRKRT